MKRTTSLIALLLALALCLCLFGCGSEPAPAEPAPAAEPADEAPAEGAAETEPAPEEHVYTTIKVGGYASTLVGTLDPQRLSSNADSFGLTNLVYDFMFYTNPADLKITSDVFSDWSWSEDFLTLTLTLKDGITFSNGDQMTGEDVLYSIERSQAGASARFYTAINVAESTVSEDGLTIALKYDTVYNPGIKKLDIGIVNKDFVEALPEDADWFDIANACGSGPYTITSLVADSSATFELREDYWNAEAKPSIDAIEAFVYTDQNTMVIDLQNGVIDMAVNCSVTDTQSILDGAYAGVSVDVVSSNSVVQLGLSDDNPFFQDEAVRSAVCHAVDTTALCEVAYGCLGTPATGYFSENFTEIYEPLSYTYDPDFSRQQLADAGYVDNDGDGYVEDADGNKLSVFFATRSNGAYPAISEVLQQYLKDVGIELTIEVADFPTLRSTAYSTVGGTDFMCITNADGGADLVAYWEMSAWFETPMGFPCLTKADATLNEYLNQGLYNIDGTAEATEGWQSAARWLTENYWEIPMVEWCTATAYNPEVIADPNVASNYRPLLRFIELA